VPPDGVKDARRASTSPTRPSGRRCQRPERERNTPRGGVHSPPPRPASRLAERSRPAAAGRTEVADLTLSTAISTGRRTRIVDACPRPHTTARLVTPFGEPRRFERQASPTPDRGTARPRRETACSMLSERPLRQRRRGPGRRARQQPAPAIRPRIGQRPPHPMSGPAASSSKEVPVIRRAASSRSSRPRVVDGEARRPVQDGRRRQSQRNVSSVCPVSRRPRLLDGGTRPRAAVVGS